MTNVKDRIGSERLIAIIRLPAGTDVAPVVDAIIRGGINIIEFTLTSSDSLRHIERFKKLYPDQTFGAGTVCSTDDVKRSVGSGAEFIVSPIFDRDVIRECNERSIPIISGGLTPTEIYNAYTAGADYIKPFPLTGLGPKYIEAIRGPFPQIPLIPTNGVTLDNIADFFRAGVTAVGLGSVLVNAGEVSQGNMDSIVNRIREVKKILSI